MTIGLHRDSGSQNFAGIRLEGEVPSLDVGAGGNASPPFHNAHRDVIDLCLAQPRQGNGHRHLGVAGGHTDQTKGLPVGRFVDTQRHVGPANRIDDLQPVDAAEKWPGHTGNAW